MFLFSIIKRNIISIKQRQTLVDIFQYKTIINVLCFLPHRFFNSNPTLKKTYKSKFNNFIYTPHPIPTLKMQFFMFCIRIIKEKTN